MAEELMLDLRNIHKSFFIGTPNEFEVLHGLNFTVNKGEFVSIVGQSGSGKSTLMNIIGALDRPTEGEYTLDGVDIEKAKDHELSALRNKKIGFVFQTYNLIARTNALKNVELPMMYAGIGRGERLERAKKLLDEVGMTDRMMHNPDELSGGQKVRVMLALILISRPKFLLLDEPFGDLDPVTLRDVTNALKTISKDYGITIVMISHNTEFIKELSNRAVFMDDGKIIDDSEDMDQIVGNFIDFCHADYLKGD